MTDMNECLGKAKSYDFDLQALLDASPDVLCSFDSEGIFTFASAACSKLWGYTSEELLGHKYMDFVHLDDQQKTLQIATDIMSGKSFTYFENRYYRKDGTIVPVLWSACWDMHKKLMHCVARNASEKIEYERKANEYKERLYRAYKLSKIGWWELDLATHEHSASDELYMIYGLTRKEYPTLNRDVYLQFVHPKDLEKVKKAFTLLEQKEEFDYSHRFIKPSGEIIYVQHHIHVERNELGSITRINGTTKDISKERKAKKKLLQTERKVIGILESIQDGFFALDHHWTVIYWNQKAEEVLSKKKEDIIGKNLWEEYKEALPLKFFSEYQKAMREQVQVHFEEFLPTVNKWFEVNAYPSCDGLSIYFKDITLRKIREQDLKISNERFEFVSKATSDIIWDWDLKNNQLMINESFYQAFGHKVKQNQSHAVWNESLHPDDKNHVLNSKNIAISDPNCFNWKESYRFIKADGSIAFVSDKAVIIRDENNNAIRMVGAVSDITESKLLQEANLLAKERYHLMFEEAPIPKWIFDEETLQFLEVNKAAVEQYGFAKEEFLRMNILEIRPESEKSKVFQLRKQRKIKGEPSFKGIVKHQTKNGTLIDVELSTHSYVQHGRTCIVVVANNVTEKLEAHKEMSRAIIQAQERERSIIGKELHDNVNQMLTTAKLYVQNIKYFPGQEETFIYKSTDILQKSIEEIRNLSKALITPTLSDIGFKETIDELSLYYRDLKLFEVDLSYHITEVEATSELKLSIYRILQELFNNTVKYAKASHVRVNIHSRQGFIRVVYVDNGIGFNLKPEKKGVGINNIKSRVLAHRGRVKIEAESGKGCKVLIVLPKDN